MYAKKILNIPFLDSSIVNTWTDCKLFYLPSLESESSNQCFNQMAHLAVSEWTMTLAINLTRSTTTSTMTHHCSAYQASILLRSKGWSSYRRPHPHSPGFGREGNHGLQAAPTIEKTLFVSESALLSIASLKETDSSWGRVMCPTRPYKEVSTLGSDSQDLRSDDLRGYTLFTLSLWISSIRGNLGSLFFRFGWYFLWSCGHGESSPTLELTPRTGQRESQRKCQRPLLQNKSQIWIITEANRLWWELFLIIQSPTEEDYNFVILSSTASSM